MYDIGLPKPNTIELLKDNFLVDLRRKILSGEIIENSNNPFEKFTEMMLNYIQQSNCFNLQNLELFPIKEIIIGCHHYIDGIFISKGMTNLQILEHEYKYYEKLNPSWEWAKPGNLKPNCDLIIATPFPGYLDLHPEFDNILNECSSKHIGVHLDCAWLSCSNNIKIDVSHPSIKSIGVSLSKGCGASWNRIGVRFTKEKISTDPITIFNNANMCPESVVRNGISLLEHVPMDYMWNKYGATYYSLIKKYNLEEGKILFAAYGQDRIIYSLSHLLKEMET